MEGISTWEMISVFIVVGFIILWIWMAKKGDIEIQKYKDDLKEQGLEVVATDEITYYGGYDDIGECNSSFIKVFNKKLELSFFGNTDEGSFAIQRDINYLDLVNIEVKTQFQIQENPSLGKIFMFGILALGMKGKNREIESQFIVINTKTNSIILKPSGSCLDLARDINKCKNSLSEEIV